MRQQRVIEIWEAGPAGEFLGRVQLRTIPLSLLQTLLGDEQAQPDPEFLASYWLDADKCAALQPFCDTVLDAQSFDYILSMSWVVD